MLVFLLLPAALSWSSQFGAYKHEIASASYFRLNAVKRLYTEQKANTVDVNVSNTVSSTEATRERKVKLNKYQEYSKVSTTPNLLYFYLFVYFN